MRSFDIEVIGGEVIGLLVIMVLVCHAFRLLLCMTDIKMDLLFVIPLLSLVTVIMYTLVSSVNRSLGRREVTVKMRIVRKKYLRLRMIMLCKW